MPLHISTSPPSYCPKLPERIKATKILLAHAPLMRRRRFILRLNNCAVAAILTAPLWPRDREPRIQSLRNHKARWTDVGGSVSMYRDPFPTTHHPVARTVIASGNGELRLRRRYRG